MNIFVLDENPIVAAEYHNNKHCVKMILESTQLLSNAFWLNNLSGCYKLTHKHHPATRWVAQSYGNFQWLMTMAIALCKEYTHRYGKRHKCEEKIQKMSMAVTNIKFKTIEMTPFVQCMPEQYRGIDAVEAYRAYYNAEKSRFSKWTGRPAPKWYCSK